MGQSLDTFPDVVDFRAGTCLFSRPLRAQTVPGSSVRDGSKPGSIPAALTQSQDSPHTQRGGRIFPMGIPQGAGVGSFLGSEKDIALWLRWGIPVDFTVPMGGAYCFPKHKLLREKKG